MCRSWFKPWCAVHTLINTLLLNKQYCLNACWSVCGHSCGMWQMCVNEFDCCPYSETWHMLMCVGKEENRTKITITIITKISTKLQSYNIEELSKKTAVTNYLSEGLSKC